jgi:hypothetical protein
VSVLSPEATWSLILLIPACALVAAWLLSIWWRERGARAIVCPENSRPAGVRVDARHAALTAIGGKAEFQLSSCTRWPERAGCGQQCLSQIHDSPDGCLVRNMVGAWYQGKTCSLCGKSFQEIQWTAQKPALIGADKISVEWSRIPADRLTETLQTASPVCFACHMAATLVREHPDLVTDRSCRISEH